MRLDVDLKDTFACIRTSDGQAVGVLSNRMFKTLSALEQVESIRVQPLMTVEEWNDKLKKLQELPKKSKTIVRMKVDILVFGPRKSKQLQGIAEELAISEYYLQQPHHYIVHCSYENPQSLQIPRLQASTLIRAEKALQDAEEVDKLSNQDQQAEATALSSLVLDIDSFFNELPKHDYLSHVPIDKRVQTGLYEFVTTSDRATLEVKHTDALF
jgi:hypothetical protein